MSLQDFRQAIRRLRLAPGFTLAAVGSIALGIAGNVTIFSLVNAILIKPLPYPEPERLVTIKEMWVGNHNPSLPNVLPVLGFHLVRWREEVESIESMECVNTEVVRNMKNLDGPGEPERVGAIRISAGFLNLLGLQPQLGRWFTRAEELNGAPDVIIIGDSLWRRHFSADPRIIGTRILLEGTPHEVIGVTPRNLRFFRRHQLHPLIRMPDSADVLTPLRLRPEELEGSVFSPNCAVIARLKRGRTLEQARTEIDASLARIRLEHPGRWWETHPIVETLENTLVGDTRKALLVLLGSVGLVLLIVCVNVANLMLVRGTNRRREFALRAALGAARRRLITQSLAESALLAASGAAAGTLLAWWIMDVVVQRAPVQWARLEDARLDGNVLAFAAGLCLLTTILFGILPAWRASQVSPLEALQASARGNTDGPRGGRLRTALVSVGVALSTVLLIVAGLLLASFQHILTAPRGFAHENVAAVDLRLSAGTYRTNEQCYPFYRRVIESVASIPGVLEAGYSESLPLASWDLLPVVKENSPLPSPKVFGDVDYFALSIRVSGGYFQTMGIPLRSGRFFNDDGEKELVALVSESAAQRIWPGENAIGKRFRNGTDQRFMRVVGVVADTRTETLGRNQQPAIYRPYFQFGGRDIKLLVRTAAEPAAIARAIRHRIWSVDRAVPVPELRTIAGVVSDAVAPRRFQTVLVTAFALLALVLAMIGIYGVVSYVVLQRRAEIGVRMALGASQWEICSMMLKRGMRPVVLGLGAGVLTAVGATRLMTSLLCCWPWWLPWPAICRRAARGDSIRWMPYGTSN
jgi:putative ABC transport system permease protein